MSPQLQDEVLIPQPGQLHLNLNAEASAFFTNAPRDSNVYLASRITDLGYLVSSSTSQEEFLL